MQIGLLHGIMSDKEYNVITSCISTNLSEAPNLPPGFRDNVNRTKDSIRLLADKVNLNNHLLLSRTVVVMTVDVQYALFELRNGPDAESPLAELVVSYLVLLQREMFLQIFIFGTINISFLCHLHFCTTFCVPFFLCVNIMLVITDTFLFIF